MKQELNHLAIIMDGNARWAEAHGKTKAEGHKKGAETAKTLLPAAAKMGIKYLTLYAFSSENWQRPADEVSILINLLSYYVKNETKILNENGIKLKVIGNLDKLSTNLQEKIAKAVDATKDNNKMTATIAFGYGGRDEILQACQKALDSDVQNITEEQFKSFLYDPEMPDVDLLIRPSGLYRISNFLLWQIAYAELYFSEKFWPDFNEQELQAAITDYSNRTRSFGGR
ncbi:polyprenyl diphosphate synthase [Rickettsiaceae bacterium]|nr:polyprenyl diphosphate synthase [Rickettsiaceae bacterium]